LQRGACHLLEDCRRGERGVRPLFYYPRAKCRQDEESLPVLAVKGVRLRLVGVVICSAHTEAVSGRSTSGAAFPLQSSPRNEQEQGGSRAGHRWPAPPRQHRCSGSTGTRTSQRQHARQSRGRAAPSRERLGRRTLHACLLRAARRAHVAAMNRVAGRAGLHRARQTRASAPASSRTRA
jgi:hypothetical protein